jgi:hypothetical protein
MSVKPSDFAGQGRNISRNICGGGCNIWEWNDGVVECWSDERKAESGLSMPRRDSNVAAAGLRHSRGP